MMAARTAAISNWRWVVCALLFLATTINYMDRQVLGLLAPTLQHEIGWNETQYANIIVAFQVAYALGLVAFGHGVDIIGTRKGYALSVLVWSGAAMVHALARSATGFGVARFALGLGESGNFPAAVKAVSEWFPLRERALANGIFNSGCNVGAVLAPLLVPWLTLRWGWPAAFIVLGVLGLIWLIFWLLFYEMPARSRFVAPAVLAHIRSGSPETRLPRISLARLLACRQAWAFVVGYAFSAPIWWFYLYWLPKFLNQQYGLDLASLGAPLVVIYLMASVGSVGGGWLSSALLQRGWSLNASRKTAMLVCALCVVPVVFAAHAPNLWVATVLIGIAASAHQGWAANLFALASDLFPSQAVGSVVGLGGMAGALTAVAFSESTGFILETTGSYWSLFAVAASVYLAALAIIHWLSPRLQPARLD
ncbi:MAG: MFS transporter [Limisphaerales bacterium]